MKTKRVQGFALICMVLVMLFSIGSTPVWASSSSSNTPSDGLFSVIGYKLRNTNGQDLVSSITPGMSLDIVFTIKDDRQGVTESMYAVGTLNTTSFHRAPGYRPPVYAGTTTQVKMFGDNAPSALNRVSSLGSRTYELVFPVQYSGEGNSFAFDVKYIDNLTDGNIQTGVAMESYSFTLNQCVPKSDEGSDSGSGSSFRGTGFVLQSATYGAGEVYAGKDFTLSVVMLATNGDYSVENASFSVAPPQQIKLATGTSVAYVGTVKPGQSITGSFQLTTNANVEEGSYTVSISIKGISAKDGSAVEATADVTIPVVQPERFEISNARVPEYLMVGSADYATIDLVNKGIGAIYNVEAQITGEGLSTEEGKVYVGTINGGGQNSVDFNVTALQGGQLTGQVVVTYENAKGEVKTLTHDFSVTVDDMPEWSDPGIVDPGFSEPMTEGGGVPIWVWAIVGAAILAIGGVFVVVLRKRSKAKKQAELDEDLDDDEDDYDNY